MSLLNTKTLSILTRKLESQKAGDESISGAEGALGTLAPSPFCQFHYSFREEIAKIIVIRIRTIL